MGTECCAMCALLGRSQIGPGCSRRRLDRIEEVAEVAEAVGCRKHRVHCNRLLVQYRNLLRLFRHNDRIHRLVCPEWEGGLSFVVIFIRFVMNWDTYTRVVIKQFSVILRSILKWFRVRINFFKLRCTKKENISSIITHENPTKTNNNPRKCGFATVATVSLIGRLFRVSGKVGIGHERKVFHW